MTSEFILRTSKSFLFVLLIALALVFVGPITIVWGDNALFSISTLVNLIALFLIAAALILKQRSLSRESLVGIAICFAVLILLSDWPLRSFGILEALKSSGWSIFHLLCLSLIAALTTFYISSRFLFILPLLLAALLSYKLLDVLNFNLLFSDDHPTFLFRLMSLKNSFPKVPNYNPLWNGGMEFRDFFASGSLSIYLLFYPLVHFFPLEESYNYILILLFFFLPLISTYIATRLLNLDSKVFAVSSLLILTNSTIWYRWALSFGTLGFILAVQLLPVVLAITYKLSLDQNWKVREVVSAIIAVSLMLLWPISSLFLIPLIIYCLIYVKALAFKKESWVILFFLLLINLPWMFVFSKVSAVENFVKRETLNSENKEVAINEAEVSIKDTGAGSSLSADLMLSKARESLQGTNLLILFLGALSLLFYCNKKLKIIYGLTAIWLIFLATVGSIYKPQLELDRFLLVALVLFSIPTSIGILQVFSACSHLSSRYILSRSLILLLFFASVFSAVKTVGNKTENIFYAQQDIVPNIAAAIKNYANNSRTIFAGFTLHELSEGHIAPLIYFSGQPLIARSYKHDHWGYHDVIPERFRQDKGKRIAEFFDIYNIGAVITHDKNWRNFFKRQSLLYKEVWNEGRFRIFQRINFAPNYFLQGQGQIVSQLSDKIILRLTTTSGVIKFNFMPLLKSNGCTLYSHKIEGAVNLIGLRDCPINQDIVIEAKNIIERFF